MLRPSSRRIVRTVVAMIAVVALSVRPTLAIPPLSLVGTFSGTYVTDGTSTMRSIQLEVEKQHRRRLRVSVFAQDQAEFQGHGKLSQDNMTLTAKTHATGRGAPHFNISGGVDDSGATVVGTFVLINRGHANVTGTFSVGR